MLSAEPTGILAVATTTASPHHNQDMMQPRLIDSSYDATGERSQEQFADMTEVMIRKNDF